MKNKIKTHLDYIQLLFLLASAGHLLWSAANSVVLLSWKHYVGLGLLIAIGISFYIKHLYGVLCLGLTLLLGLIGLLSYSPAITTTTFGWGNGDPDAVTLLRFQPIFLLWTIIYFVLSGRHFVGIASKKYWAEVRSKER